jgi:hypothetical protein
VVNYGIFVLAIPEIKLDTATSAEQRLSVNFDRRFPSKLVTYKPNLYMYMSAKLTAKPNNHRGTGGGDSPSLPVKYVL